MKYTIIGDLHGTELGDLEKVLSFEKPDFLICTGDFDQIKTIHQFKDLEKAYQKKGIKVIKVPGNHDHAILKNIPITSGTLRQQGKTCSGLHQELMNDPIAKQYIDELVNSKNPRDTNNRVKIFLDEDKFGKKYPTIIIHGAYKGDLSSFFDCPLEAIDLWMRLTTIGDYSRNFDAMEEKGEKIMIRGHDHYAIYVYQDPHKGIITHKPKVNGSTYHLFKNRKHVINPGALFDGLFATIDTNVLEEKTPILKYRKL